MILIYLLFLAQKIMVEADLRGQPREWALLAFGLMRLVGLCRPFLPPGLALLLALAALASPLVILAYVRRCPDERRRPLRSAMSVPHEGVGEHS